MVVASRIGVNRHTLNRWLTNSRSPTKPPPAPIRQADLGFLPVILDRAFRSQHQSAPISLHLRRTCPSRIECISDFLLACFEVAPGAACSDLGRRQNAFGFHHERAERFGSLCANFFTNSRQILTTASESRGEEG